MVAEPTEFGVNKQAIFIPGPSGKLEAITTRPKDNAKPIVSIVCHPHPLYLGTMNNKVITTIARAFEHLGLATVRFNYRGVGESEGGYGHMVGESEDLLAVVDWVKRVLPDHDIWLAGFSFGAYISANVANQIKGVTQLVSIAPAVNHADFSVLTDISCPWLVVMGEEDEIVPFVEVERFAMHPPVPLKFIPLPGVTHFFHGQMVELRELLKRELPL